MAPLGNNTVDAAFVKSSTQNVSNSILDIGVPAGGGRNPTFEFVQKSGRTTGYILCAVTALNVTVYVGYGSCGTARFVNQAIIEPDENPFLMPGGDSGSPVVSMAKEPVGLMFSGNTDGSILIMNPIPLVLQALGVAIF